MTLEVETIYRYRCDWPACRAALTLRGSSKMTDAQERARREGWTISVRASADPRRRSATDPYRTCRCPDHGYRTRPR